MQQRKLIVGLGNPGRQYVRTRHNLGYWVLDLVADKFETPWNKTRCKAQVATADFKNWHLTLAKPTTFMNLSGQSVTSFFTTDGFVPSDLLVICDDVNLPLGRIRIRKEGSPGGHHGLESIIESIGTQKFERIRVGVKPLVEPLPKDLAGFVLERFGKGEEAVAAESARKAADAVLTLLEDGIDAAMNRHN